MDTDWCLSCGRRVEALDAYCSPECAQAEHISPSSSSSSSFIIYHHVHQVSPQSNCVAKDYHGIQAWAACIPPGSPSSSSSCASLSSLVTSSPSHSKPASPLPSPMSSPTFKPKRPRLMVDSERPVRPTLCMSTPQPPPVSPSLPIASPRHRLSQASQLSSANSKTLTDSSLATPISAAVPIVTGPSSSVFGSIANHVKSWVNSSPSAEQHPARRSSTPSSHTPTKPDLPPSPPTPSHNAPQYTVHLPKRAPASPSPRHSSTSHAHAVPFSPFPTSLRPSAFLDEDDLSSSDLSSSPSIQKPIQISPISAHYPSRRDPRPHQYQVFPPQSALPAQISNRRQMVEGNGKIGKVNGMTTGRMPVGTSLEEHGIDHPAYRSRGRKPSRALA